MLSDIQFTRTSMCDKYATLFLSKFYDIPVLQSKIPDNVKNMSSQYFYDHGFSIPLFVEDSNGSLNLLKLKLPTTRSLEGIADIIGHNFPVKVCVAFVTYNNVMTYLILLAHRSCDADRN